MSKQFNHLNIPSHWQSYWSRFPEGHTILEALIQWVSQVDEMVDNQNKLSDTVTTYGSRLDQFIDQFDGHLTDEVKDTLGEWQQSGFLDDVINDALDTKYHEMDNRLTTQLIQTERELDNKKIDKNRGAVSSADLSQEVKEQITGGSVAVVGENAILENNIVDGQVTPVKTSFIGKSKNLFNGEYENLALWSNGTIEREEGAINFLTKIPIAPNTTYTISKTESSNFRIGLNNEASLATTSSEIVHNDRDSNEFTVKSGIDQDIMVVYVGRDNAPDFMQVEESPTRTEWVTYGDVLKDGSVPYYASGDVDSAKHFGIKGDGITDDTKALKGYAEHLRTSGGGVLELPPNSTILFTETISIPSNVLVRGNMSTLKLGDDYVLEARDFRGNPNIYPYITTDTNSSDIHFENLTIVGNKNDFRNQRHSGLSFIDVERASAVNVNVYEINYNIALAETYGTMAYNLSTVRAKDVYIYGGTFDKGGYECVGVEQSQGVTIDNVRSGKGWRTSLQIHRDSQNIKVLNSTIRQVTDTDDAGALTLHGQDDLGQGLKNIQLIGNTITGNFSSEPKHSYNALIQIMDGGTAEDILVKDNILKGNRTGIYGTRTKNFSVLGNNLKIEKGNGINVYSDSSNVLIDQNIVEVMDGIALSGSTELATLGTNIGF